MMETLHASLMLVLDPEVIAIILASSAFGLFVGAVPGLSATLATALLVPITFFMPPIMAISSIISCAAMAIYAGDITGALLRIPGTAASAAYTEDSYRLTQAGRLPDALGASLIAAAIGGTIGTIVLVTASSQLAKIALSFSSFEYFWLVLLGLSAGVLVSPASPYKALVSLGLGLLLSSVGLALTGQPRFTMGIFELQAGIALISVLIGAFAVAELFRKAETVSQEAKILPKISGNVLAGQFRNVWRRKVSVVRGSLLGVVVGIIPGAGCDVAAWLAYATSKRFSKTPEKFGKGHQEGIIEAGASNNSAISGAFVPTLVFGVPGDALTAIVVGILLIKGITPGPSVFVDSATLVYAMFIVFFLANFLLIPLGTLAIYCSRNILAVKDSILYPIILIFCVTGAFATNNTVFDIWIIAISGFAVWLLSRNGYPAAPLVLGMVLGNMLETHFFSSVLKARGSIVPFFDRPIAGTLGVITLIVWVLIFVLPHVIRIRRKKQALKEAAEAV